MMHAISLWEPWATAMAIGLKANETRHWPTTFRGDLVICAAKRRMTAIERELFDDTIKPHFNGEVPYGHAVCVVEVYDCVPTHRIRASLADLEISLGNYETGRFAWLTRNLRRLSTPIAITGRQGFFNVPFCVEAEIRAQLSGSHPPAPREQTMDSQLTLF